MICVLKIKRKNITLIHDMGIFIACIVVLSIMFIKPEVIRFNDSKEYLSTELTRLVEKDTDDLSTNVVQRNVIEKELSKVNIRIIIVLLTSIVLIVSIGIQLVIVNRLGKGKIVEVVTEENTMKNI